MREPEHLMLARPRDRRVEQAGDADPMRQPAIDGGFDKARREERQRDRHMDVPLAAGLPRLPGNGMERQIAARIHYS